MAQYFTGAQNPLLKPLLRAAAVRRNLSGYVEFQLNDTDTAGVVAGPPSVAVQPRSVDGWWPLEWTYPFTPLVGPSHISSQAQCLRVAHPSRLAIAGLDVSRLLDLRDLIRGQVTGEAAWAAAAAIESGIASAAQVEERIQHLADAVTRSFLRANGLADVWLGIGRHLMGSLLDGVDCVSFARASWILTAASAESPRHDVLNECLAKPRLFLDALSHAKTGRELAGSSSLLPFYVTYERDSWMVREQLQVLGSTVRLGDAELRSTAPVRSAADLARTLSEAGILASVVPTILPMMVQLRTEGSICVSNPAYLQAASKLAAYLAAEQNAPIYVSFDLQRALGTQRWVALVRWASMRGLTHREIGYWKLNPTLIFLWVLGGYELLESTVATATLDERT